MKTGPASRLVVAALTAWTLAVSAAKGDTRHVVLPCDARKTLPGRSMLGERLRTALAVMWTAVDFLLTHGSRIFPSTAIAFGSIDRRQLGGRPLLPRVTGVRAKRGFGGTIVEANRGAIWTGNNGALARRFLSHAPP